MRRGSDVTCRKQEIPGVVAAGLVMWAPMVNAAAPVTLDGWRYLAGPNDLHVFVCERPDCVPGSRVACNVGPPDSALPPWVLRKAAAAAAETAGEHPKSGSKSAGLALDLMGRGLSVETASDGTKTYHASSTVNGATSQFILTSSSIDEKASQANLDRFEAALKAISK
jgi:hypothetical protein